ncbi:MAG: molecular chaperone, small heat shock protein [halophilic archaeon J07HX64]|jgi:Molecular chaperone (small heat shock protein)|nr:MAG: molecular chaperone, small heat shock protein [halophilic archaeon J07HX64]
MSDRDDPLAEIEALFDQFTDFGTTMSADIPVDVLDRDDEVVVLADLPGRETGEIQLRLEDERSLQIEAPAPIIKEGQHVVRGRPRTEMSRSVQLPAAVDESDTEASYDQGVLTVRLGKPGDRESTDIEVT